MKTLTWVTATFEALTRLRVWAVVIAILLLAQVPAERYLTSFGPPGLSTSHTWTLASLAYDVRHAPTLHMLAPLGLFAIALVAAWAAAAVRDATVTFRWLGWRLLKLALMALAMVELAFLTPRSFPEVRRAGFADAADRMAPLVSAVTRFEQAMGRPPYELRELVPRYLATIEPFGVRGCRSLQYTAGSSKAASRWELRFECPNGMLTLDQFFYHPSGEYPAWEGMEQVRDWAYYWD